MGLVPTGHVSFCTRDTNAQFRVRLESHGAHITTAAHLHVFQRHKLLDAQLKHVQHVEVKHASCEGHKQTSTHTLPLMKKTDISGLTELTHQIWGCWVSSCCVSRTETGNSLISWRRIPEGKQTYKRYVRKLRYETHCGHMSESWAHQSRGVLEGPHHVLPVETTTSSSSLCFSDMIFHAAVCDCKSSAEFKNAEKLTFCLLKEVILSRQ